MTVPCLGGSHDSQLWTQAYAWLCQRRRRAPANDDIWHLRFHWARLGPALLQQVLANRYRLSAMRCVGQGPARRPMWSASDALVLKWLALRIAPCLPVHPACTHVRGHGGLYGAQAQARAAVASGRYGFVLRTDIRGYYRHIRRGTLLALLWRHLHDPLSRRLLRQRLYYSVEDGGLFHTPRSGIPRGCPLSPLLGAVLLTELDRQLAAHRALCYLRYMDDFLLLSPTRWPLRRATAELVAGLVAQGFERHPDKTEIGRLAKGFEWLGIRYDGTGAWTLSQAVRARHEQRCALLQQRVQRLNLPPARVEEALARYRQRWQNWCATACGEV